MKRWTDIHDDPDGWVEVEIVEAAKVPRLARKQRRLGRPRLICDESKRAEIRAAYLAGSETLREIGQRYGVSSRVASYVGRSAA